MAKALVFALMSSLLVKASAIHEMIDVVHSEIFESQSATGQDHQTILDRLDRIEAALGINGETPEGAPTVQGLATAQDDADSAPLEGVWQAVAHLRTITRPAPDVAVWARPIVRRLWIS